MPVRLKNLRYDKSYSLCSVLILCQKDVLMMKKNKVLFLIFSMFAFSLISCETPPEERTCGDANILKSHKSKG